MSTTTQEVQIQESQVRTANDIATVKEQIAEDELALIENKRRVTSYREAIKALRDDSAMREARIKRNKARRQVFARAKFELEQIDDQ